MKTKNSDNSMRLGEDLTDNSIKTLIKIGILISIAGIIFALIGSNTPCLFRRVTGFICPSCGMTRAWCYVLMLNFPKAFYMHPLFFTATLIPILILKEGRLLKNEKANTITILSVGGAYLLVYAIRLVVYFTGNLYL